MFLNCNSQSFMPDEKQTILSKHATSSIFNPRKLSNLHHPGFMQFFFAKNGSKIPTVQIVSPVTRYRGWAEPVIAAVRIAYHGEGVFYPDPFCTRIRDHC